MAVPGAPVAALTKVQQDLLVRRYAPSCGSTREKYLPMDPDAFLKGSA